MFVHEIRVRFGDTDPFGVAYFVSYFRYIKDSVDEYLRSVGFEPERFYRDEERGVAMPIVESKCKFEEPARYDDLLQFHTRTGELRDRVVSFETDVYRREKYLANGYVTCVCVDDKWRPVKIPKDIRERLE